MNCKKCGSQLLEGAKFCINCGEKVKNEETEATNKVDFEETPNSAVSVETKENNLKEDIQEEKETSPDIEIATDQIKESSNNKNKKKLFLIGACIATIIVIVCIVAVMNANPTIKLSDYTIVEVNGYDGLGTASISIDWDEIEEKYGNKIKFTNNVEKDAKAYGFTSDLISALGTPMDYMKMSYTVSADKKSELSNGDRITITYSGDEDIANYFTCNVVLDSLEYNVTELEEAEKKDIFENMKVEFSGVNGNGSLSYNYEGNENINFTADKKYSLSNGDTVTITADISDLNDFADENGYIPESLEKTYTVSNMKAYCKSIDEIPQAAKNAMKAQADDKITSMLSSANSYDQSTYSFEDPSYIGDYMLTLKTSAPSRAYSNNEYGLVYKFTYVDNYKNTTKEGYEVVYFKNISANEEGDFEVDLESEWTSGYVGPYTVRIFETLDETKNDMVDSHLDLYVAEWSLS